MGLFAKIGSAFKRAGTDFKKVMSGKLNPVKAIGWGIESATKGASVVADIFTDPLGFIKRETPGVISDLVSAIPKGGGGGPSVSSGKATPPATTTADTTTPNVSSAKNSSSGKLPSWLVPLVFFFLKK